jgi:PAS domain S-box-containing protein
MNTDQFFTEYYKNAEVNSILIMECDGTIKSVNKSFTSNFGYDNEEITGRNFSILFTLQDNQKNKPGLELKRVISEGQAHDENYLVDKDGHAIWCTGEVVLVTGEQGKKYIVKDIINLQAKRQLQMLLMETEDMLEKVFEGSKEIAIMTLDATMKIQKVNAAFLHLFELGDVPAVGSGISQINHPFWNRNEVKNEIRMSIVNNEPMKGREYRLDGNLKEEKTIRVHSKITNAKRGFEKRIFLIIEELTTDQPESSLQ